MYQCDLREIFLLNTLKQEGVLLETLQGDFQLAPVVFFQLQWMYLLTLVQTHSPDGITLYRSYFYTYNVICHCSNASSGIGLLSFSSGTYDFIGNFIIVILIKQQIARQLKET